VSEVLLLVFDRRVRPQRVRDLRPWQQSDKQVGMLEEKMKSTGVCVLAGRLLSD
jgi:hypothetical protein